MATNVMSVGTGSQNIVSANRCVTARLRATDRELWVLGLTKCKHQQALKPNGSSETLASTIRTGSKTLCRPTDQQQTDLAPPAVIGSLFVGAQSSPKIV